MWYRFPWWWMLMAVCLFPLVSGCGGSDSNGSPSGLTGRIVFSSDRLESLTDNIYITNADGTGTPSFVAGYIQRNWNPDFSPDGTFIVFQNMDASQYGDIYRVNPEGTGQSVFLTPDNYGDDLNPDVSPDSTRIAFASDRDGNMEIYTMSAVDGSDLVRLTNNSASDSQPEFTPDGKIAFVSNRDGNDEIYIMDANGSNQTRLTDNTARDSLPAVSPLGNQIAFQSYRDGTRIYTMNMDGSGEQHFADGSHPCYSPDGKWIAFADRSIFARQISGGQTVNITNAGEIYDDNNPSWGP